ncbi:MAG: hypothetical protein V3V62_07780 [bacterium]
MVIEKLDALESALMNMLEEFSSLRSARADLEAQMAEVRAEASGAAEKLHMREEELERLRGENGRLQQEHADIRARVERILSHIPSG